MRTFIIILIILTGATAFAQTDLAAKQVSITIAGTSTLHDWEMNSGKAKINASVQLENGKIAAIKSLSLELPAESLKSEKEAMDNNAYKALKTKQYKTISFTLSTATVEQNGNSCKIAARGKLVIAGVTQNVVINATGSVDAHGAVTFTGSYALKMTDYKVEPPTFMFGSIKTGDAITIGFNVTLAEASNISLVP